MIEELNEVVDLCAYRSGRHIIPLYREYDGVLAQVTQDESDSEVRPSVMSIETIAISCRSIKGAR